MKNKRFMNVSRSIFAALLVMLSLWVVNLVDAATFPSKPITVIVAFAPGGNMDGHARMLARLMPDYLPNRVPVIVQNVIGAQSQKGTLVLYRSKPNGYAISVFQMPSQMLDSLIHQKKAVGEDIMNVTWLGVMTTYVNVGYVKTDSPYKTVADLKAQRDRKIKIGSSGGSGLYNATLVPHALGIETQLVTGYKSSGEVVVGLVRGDVDLIHQSVATGLKYVENGDIRPLFIIGPKRVKEFPDTPTLTEFGYPELENCYAGRFVVGPPGMDPAIADILSEAIKKSINNKTFLDYCEKEGLDAVTPAKNRQETETMARDNFKIWNKYINLFTK